MLTQVNFSSTQSRPYGKFKFLTRPTPALLLNQVSFRLLHLALQHLPKRLSVCQTASHVIRPHPIDDQVLLLLVLRLWQLHSGVVCVCVWYVSPHSQPPPQTQRKALQGAALSVLPVSKKNPTFCFLRRFSLCSGERRRLSRPQRSLKP